MKLNGPNSIQISNMRANFKAKRYISLKKGAQIKSYLISHALITAGFKIWKEIHLYTDQRLTLRILYCKCLNLYLVFVKIYLIRIKCLTGGGVILLCIQTARRRCVLKIYWLSRLKMFGPQLPFCPAYGQFAPLASKKWRAKRLMVGPKGIHHHPSAVSSIISRLNGGFAPPTSTYAPLASSLSPIRQEAKPPSPVGYRLDAIRPRGLRLRSKLGLGPGP